jgi:hypothetical protein
MSHRLCNNINRDHRPTQTVQQHPLQVGHISGLSTAPVSYRTSYLTSNGQAIKTWYSTRTSQVSTRTLPLVLNCTEPSPTHKQLLILVKLLKNRVDRPKEATSTIKQRRKRKNGRITIITASINDITVNNMTTITTTTTVTSTAPRPMQVSVRLETIQSKLRVDHRPPLLIGQR